MVGGPADIAVEVSGATVMARPGPKTTTPGSTPVSIVPEPVAP